MEAVTAKQLEILCFISNYIKKEQWAPTYSELCKGVGLRSKSTIHAHMQRIETKGLIEREKGSARAVRITEKGKKVLEDI